MKTLEQWFDEYGQSHRNPRNRALHKVCVPAIQWSLLGLLWAVKLGPINLAWLVFAGALVFYARLSARAFAFMAVESLVMLALAAAVERAGWPLVPLCVAVFVIAWIGQFIGHHIEGKKPSFFQDLQFLLIGPLWVAKDLIPLETKK